MRRVKQLLRYDTKHRQVNRGAVYLRSEFAKIPVCCGRYPGRTAWQRGLAHRKHRVKRGKGGR